MKRLTRETALAASSPAWKDYRANLVGYKLRSRHVAGVPFPHVGTTESGILVQHNQHYPPVLFRVLACAPDCDDLRPGDVVRIKPYVFDEVDTKDGRYFAVMDERRAMAVIEGLDDARTDEVRSA